VGTDKTLHLHGEGGEWLGSYGATGAPAQQVVWLGSRPVGLIQARKVFYIESDHLGSPRAVVDPQRDVAVWRWSLLGEAFGSGMPAEVLIRMESSSPLIFVSRGSAWIRLQG
jgi:hypothetical protein